MADAPILGGTKKAKLDDTAFGATFNEPLVHESVRAELAARRQGTHATKTRGKVRGGGAKPWRQKGTGRARAGTSRSPLWTGGGTVFGPSPRHYIVKVSGTSKGKGFQGTIKRHNFASGPKSHGSHNKRAPGSIGASATPSRVFKGIKGPGQMGNKRITQKGLTVVQVDAEKNLLLVKGAVPGPSGSLVFVRNATKAVVKK